MIDIKDRSGCINYPIPMGNDGLANLAQLPYPYIRLNIYFSVVLPMVIYHTPMLSGIFYSDSTKI